MSDQTAYQLRLALVNAQVALQQKNKMEARRWAATAIKLAPENEEAWLILAAISSPSASVEYLHKVLQINPKNERAIKGLKWALSRQANARIADSIIQEKPDSLLKPEFKPVELELDRPVKSEPVISEPVISEPVIPESVISEPVISEPAFIEPDVPEGSGSGPFITEAESEQEQKPQALDSQELETVEGLLEELRPIAPPIPQKIQKSRPKAQRKGAGFSWGAATILLLIVISSAVVVWAAMPGLTALARSSSAPIPGGKLNKPSLTPTLTVTPTLTLTPTPTATPTPLPTETPQPTQTPIPVNTPVPVPTSAPAQNTYNQPSTDLSGHWIDIDLSEQRLYAYDGDTMVSSFLISSGTSAHPTVTGTFKVYVKYRYTDMSGPGYYLPDVPYTMYFYQGYGIHGTYWHNNFGTPMSHGCVNMLTSEAEWVYDFSQVGTPVVVHF